MQLPGSMLCVCTCRVSRNVPQKSHVQGATTLDSQQPMLQDDHTYSTVDDMQGQMFMVSSNPAYGTVTEYDKQPVPQDDHTYSTVDSSEQDTVVTSGSQAYATSLRAASSAK